MFSDQITKIVHKSNYLNIKVAEGLLKNYVRRIGGTQTILNIKKSSEENFVKIKVSFDLSKHSNPGF